ncbi:MAG TPA: tRNA (N6-isopentenyl adenosine(37)-C2)-methylthiotransferase MiaB [Verrucomicrobiales bacterium]|nr:tRNA (N6-isopentenyl adenosine(37)-C2)-methylthiotransferase MiaB [Verrucomicrobiales bacterium]
MPRVFIKTYGCQMNVRDSEQVAEMFRTRGYTLASAEDDADVILVNTCSVRDQAEQKALGKMGQMGRLRKSNPHLVFGFLGCMAQSRGAELLREIPHLDLVAGTQKYHRVVDHVDAIWKAREHKFMDDLRAPIIDIEEESGSQNTIRDHRLRERQTTAFVSIMQGCNMKCSFCIVPSTRGSERSRPIAEITREVEDLAAQGIREVTLLGQIVNLYGRREFPQRDGKSPFVQLLEAVHAVEGIARIRFTSPHPIGYRADLIEAFTRLPKLTDHVHLPLQSGSDRILRLMRRPYTAERFTELCCRMRQARPGLAITTDIIVGFPGETEEDYAATRSLVQEIGFDNAFIFRYSPRRDTPAGEMANQLPESVKEERNQDLLRVVESIATARNASLVGAKLEVLGEGPSKTNAARLTGRTRTNRIVIFEGRPERHIGTLFPVRIEESTGFTLYGTPALAS